METQDGSNQDLEDGRSSGQLCMNPPYTLPTPDNACIQHPEKTAHGMMEMDSRVSPPVDTATSAYSSPVVGPSGYTSWATSSLPAQQSRLVSQTAYDKQGQPVVI